MIFLPRNKHEKPTTWPHINKESLRIKQNWMRSSKSLTHSAKERRSRLSIPQNKSARHFIEGEVVSVEWLGAHLTLR